mgnify:CR=1 FL=1
MGDNDFRFDLTDLPATWYGSGLEITIDRDRVTVTSEDTEEDSEWSEPLANYKGVGKGCFSIPRAGRGMNTFYYVVQLEHEDKKKNVTVYLSSSEEGLRKAWEDTARALELPALEGGSDSEIRRDPADLDKSVRELAAEGRLTNDFDPSAPPPPGIRTQIDGDVLEVTLSRFGGRPVSVFFRKLIFLVVIVAFLYVGFCIRDDLIFFGIAGIACAVSFFFTLLFEVIRKSVVRITPREVDIFSQYPWGRSRGTVLPADDIETVHVQKEGGKNIYGTMYYLIVSTDQKKELIGRRLSKETLEWMKDCILKIVTM